MNVRNIDIIKIFDEIVELLEGRFLLDDTKFGSGVIDRNDVTEINDVSHGFRVCVITVNNNEECNFSSDED